jgi:ribA/ribD-fused uncharacterized protein
LAQGLLDTKGGFVMFWKPEEAEGYLGNWFESPFEAGGVAFNCNEQYMMYHKALLMGDEATAQRMLAEKNPKNHKKLGQSVKPWNEELWLENRARIMYEGCQAKFSQNEELCQRLLATGDAVLVEASPLDKIWGIGLKASDPNARKQASWKGLNLLGRVLMQVRSDLRARQ